MHCSSCSLQMAVQVCGQWAQSLLQMMITVVHTDLLRRHHSMRGCHQTQEDQAYGFEGVEDAAESVFQTGHTAVLDG